MSRLLAGERLTFDPEFLFATGEDGKEIRFTRSERALLAALAGRPGVVLSRAHLLDALSGSEADISDRNIDFIVNRLRRKLNDPARAPNYIATQYGEGYWWVPQKPAVSKSTAGAFIVIGPVRGLPQKGGGAQQGRLFAQELRRQIDAATASDRRVVVDEHCPGKEDFVGERPDFAVELDFIEIRGRLDCAIVVKSFASGQILLAVRQLVANASGPGEASRETIEALAEKIMEVVWRAGAYRGGTPPAPAEQPLAIRLQQSARLLAGNGPWEEAQRRLRKALEDDPEDHESRLMLATAIHSKYIDGFPAIFLGEDRRQSDEEEMELLVLASLPHIRSDSFSALIAAKLLYFVGRGHRRLALELAEEAFAATTALATSYAVMGQLRAFEGDLDEAFALYDDGLALCEPDSQFTAYILIIKLHAVLASADLHAIGAVLEQIAAWNALLGQHMTVYCTHALEGERRNNALKLLQAIPRDRCVAHLRMSFYNSVRLFRSEQHRINVMGSLIRVMTERFGPAIVDQEVRDAMPSFFADTQSQPIRVSRG